MSGCVWRMKSVLAALDFTVHHAPDTERVLVLEFWGKSGAWKILKTHEACEPGDRARADRRRAAV